MVDRIRYPTVSHLPFYYIFFSDWLSIFIINNFLFTSQNIGDKWHTLKPGLQLSLLIARGGGGFATMGGILSVLGDNGTDVFLFQCYNRLSGMNPEVVGIDKWEWLEWTQFQVCI